ncbi:MAG: hypothetical protein C0522_05130 [Rhodocyclaceae bacterium]|jgi:hypothetical protein|nr:hypothetical protein [Rhodocyclaceae bacterium]
MAKDKLMLYLALVLPDIPDEQDARVERMIPGCRHFNGRAGLHEMGLHEQGLRANPVAITLLP